MRYLYTLHVEFHADDDVAAKEIMRGNPRPDNLMNRVAGALCEYVATTAREKGAGRVSEKLQRVHEKEPPKLVQRWNGG